MIIVYRISRTFNTNPADEAGKVLDMLGAAGAVSKNILKENSAQLSIVARIYLEGDDDESMRTPSFNLPTPFVATMCEYNLSLDVDLYVFEQQDAIYDMGEWASDPS